MVFIYLARRDRRGVRVLAELAGTWPAGRITDLSALPVPDDLRAALVEAVERKKMQWEPWVETAGSVWELYESLRRRGYQNIPVQGNPSMRGELSKSAPLSRSSMLRKR